MIYLSAEQVLFLHDRLIEETGGEHGVRDLGGLESALQDRKLPLATQSSIPTSSPKLRY